MFCIACGNEIHEEAVVCMKCGVSNNNNMYDKPVESDLYFAWGILGFFVPLVGIILYFAWISTKPKSARASLGGALIRIALILLIYVFMFSLVILDML